MSPNKKLILRGNVKHNKQLFSIIIEWMSITTPPLLTKKSIKSPYKSPTRVKKRVKRKSPNNSPNNCHHLHPSPCPKRNSTMCTHVTHALYKNMATSSLPVSWPKWRHVMTGVTSAQGITRFIFYKNFFIITMSPDFRPTISAIS